MSARTETRLTAAFVSLLKALLHRAFLRLSIYTKTSVDGVNPPNIISPSTLATTENSDGNAEFYFTVMNSGLILQKKLMQ